MCRYSVEVPLRCFEVAAEEVHASNCVGEGSCKWVQWTVSLVTVLDFDFKPHLSFEPNVCALQKVMNLSRVSVCTHYPGACHGPLWLRRTAVFCG